MTKTNTAPAIEPAQPNHASSVLYPAIKAAMAELATLPEAFNMTVNRAFNHLHTDFWSECPAPANAEPLRSETPSDSTIGKM